MTGEKWVAVQGFPNYMVSDLGRVRSLKGCWGTARGRIIKAWTQGGYRRLCLSLDFKKYSKAVHHLVLVAFSGTAPTDAHECNHKNGKKADNRAGNLEWVTRRENIRHAVQSSLYRRGRRCSWSKLSVDTMRQIRSEYVAGVPSCIIAAKRGISTTTLSAVIRGKAWTGVSLRPVTRRRIRATPAQLAESKRLRKAHTANQQVSA